MRIAGFEVENTVGTGVEGPVPLTGLTLLFGRNGTGKTVILESLASILDPHLEWTGRQPRLTDPSFAYARLFLRGDWDGDDWEWLRSVMLHQNSDTRADSSELVLGPISLNAAANRKLFLIAVITQFAQDFPDDAVPALVELLSALTSQMLVSYTPFASSDVTAVIDTSELDDETRTLALTVSRTLGTCPLGQRLAHIADPSERYVTLLKFGDLDEENFEELVLSPPTAISVDATILDTERMLVAALAQALPRRVEGPRDWLQATSNNRFSVSPGILKAVSRIQQILHERPTPAFLIETGTPEIYVPTPELWSDLGQVLLVLRRPDGRQIDVRQTSAATSRWMSVLVTLAVADWLREIARPEQAVHWSGGVPVVEDTERPVEGTVLIFDEPELHLHPLAQAQVSDWLVEIARSGTAVLTATHSPQIINAHSPLVTLVGLERSDGKSTIRDLTNNTLECLDMAAQVYGADRASWLQIARGLVLVEGQHDLQVVKHYIGEELQSQRVVLIPIRGHRNLAGTVLSEFFARFGIPVRVMLDDVKADAVLGDHSVTLNSSEEQLVRQLIHQHPNLDVVPYSDPDIICALPMEAVQRAWPKANDISWSEIERAWRERSDKVGFKPYALKRLGIKVVPDTFVSRVLVFTQPGEAPSLAFRETTRQILESLR